MNWDIWVEVEKILTDFNVKPLLSVVPDNQDQTLRVRQAKQDFWGQVRAWQNRGWTIGLHGYQHLYETTDAGLTRINWRSEFSGLPYAIQYSKLRAGVAIFQKEGVRPDIWVAPGHSFDLATIEALQEVGIACISDGFFLHPHRDHFGMVWVPQQLWRFRRMPWGVWTVCLHINQWSAQDVARFRVVLRRFSASVTDCASVIATYRDRQINPIDSMYSRLHRLGVRSRRWWLSSQLNP